MEVRFLGCGDVSADMLARIAETDCEAAEDGLIITV